MDGQRFDELTRLVAEPAPRRAVLRTLGGSLFGAALGLGGLAGLEAKKKKGKKKKKKKKRPEPCGDGVCPLGKFCCDPTDTTCCSNKDSCCNPEPGTGTCCPSPRRCGRPINNDNAPFECCPTERQWFTTAGLVRCCPDGTRSLGEGITSDDGPCCPEEKYCGPGKCCGDDAPVCLDSDTGSCCSEDAACGDTCCSGLFGDCCNGKCRNTDMAPWHSCGDYCCWAGSTCCGNEGCCNEGLVCVSPCGDSPWGCCPSVNPGCCEIDCGNNCGG